MMTRGIRAWEAGILDDEEKRRDGTCEIYLEKKTKERVTRHH